MDIANNLKKFFEEQKILGITAVDIAKKLNISKKTLSNYLNGDAYIPLEHLNNLSNIFDVSIDYLLGRTEFNLSHEKLKKVATKNLSVGQLVEKISNLDQSHKSDLYKALYYIERDNRQNKS